MFSQSKTENMYYSCDELYYLNVSDSSTVTTETAIVCYFLR